MPPKAMIFYKILAIDRFFLYELFALDVIVTDTVYSNNEYLCGNTVEHFWEAFFGVFGP